MTDQPMSILIVDDEPIKRSVLADSLGEAGYRVAVAASPLEAEPILAEMDFDVVLTDLRMPGQDGLCHISELSDGFVDKVADVVKVGDSVRVKVLLIDYQRRVKLSRKAAILEDQESETAGA